MPNQKTLNQLPMRSPETGEQYRENESKFWASSLEAANALGQTYKELGLEQVYLSLPGSEYDLRVRAIVKPDGEPSYKATLKSKSSSDEKLNRLEVETAVSPEAFAFYSAKDLPRVRKIRRQYPDAPGLTVDIIDGMEDRPLIELEDKPNLTPEQAGNVEAVRQFLSEQIDFFQKASGDPHARNEQIAFDRYARDGKKLPEIQPPIAAEAIANRIANLRTFDLENPIIIIIGGRSGSGKTTTAERVAEILNGDGQSVAQIIHVDDYNIGSTAAELQFGQFCNWDEPTIYDVNTLAQELDSRKKFQTPLPMHCYDWSISEPRLIVPGSELTPVIIVEGIWADHPSLRNLSDLYIDLPTDRATCIGRRIIRTFDGNQAANLPTPEQQLKYLIEIAEPTYEKYHAPTNYEEANAIASETMWVADCTRRYAAVQRVPRYGSAPDQNPQHPSTPIGRENDVEHSYMLHQAATDLAKTLYPKLNANLVGQFADIHDLVETEVGDTPTFDVSDSQLENKLTGENLAIDALAKYFPNETVELVRRYQSQIDPEARFVRAVDKLLPVAVDMFNDENGRLLGAQVMRQDYSVHTLDELKIKHNKLYDRFAGNFGDEFPDLLPAYALLLKLFEEAFAAEPAEPRPIKSI
ncbi:MAG: HD domain-containing protein [Candidatus Nomurabacteria bacterium]|jgi:uridine kinase/5'-deoxynucleotidase YfbR-like HD superfamily hydrolase|nr:HD domain-containing protein [Candidatus Nomurabacteria bacterium]